MKCNCNRNIEGLNQVLCALVSKYDTAVHEREVIYDILELKEMMNEHNSKRLLYGILSVGAGTTVGIKLIGDVYFQLAGNTQSIELISEIEDITGNENVFFRGYELTLINK